MIAVTQNYEWALDEMNADGKFWADDGVTAETWVERLFVRHMDKIEAAGGPVFNHAVDVPTFPF